MAKAKKSTRSKKKPAAKRNCRTTVVAVVSCGPKKAPKRKSRAKKTAKRRS